jgi:hypothetical protein
MIKPFLIALTLTSLSSLMTPSSHAQQMGNHCAGTGSICGNGNSIGGLYSGNTSNTGNTHGSYNGAILGSYNQDNRRYDNREYQHSFNQNQRYNNAFNQNQRYNNQHWNQKTSNNQRSTNVLTDIHSEVSLW